MQNTSFMILDLSSNILNPTKNVTAKIMYIFIMPAILLQLI